MAKLVVLEEFHVTVLAPRGLPLTAYDRMRQTVNSALVVTRLRHPVRRVFRRQASLNQAEVRLSR